jgi:hypothetical protein
MAFPMHSQHAFASGAPALPIYWSAEEGHARARWIIANRPRPYTPIWFKWARNAMNIGAAAVYPLETKSAGIIRRPS